jgi:hypothetical protein
MRLAGGAGIVYAPLSGPSAATLSSTKSALVGSDHLEHIVLVIDQHQALSS